MRIEFQLSLADYREAQQMVARSPTNRPPSLWYRMQFLVYAFALVGAGVVFTIFEAILSPRPVPGGPDSSISKILPVILVLFPWLLVQGLIWPLLCRVLPPRDRTASRNLQLLLMLAMLANAILTAYLVSEPQQQEQPVGFGQWVLSNLSMWLFLATYLAIIIRYLRGMVERAWGGQQHLHLPMVVEATDDSLRISDTNHSTLYQWTAFKLFKENSSLFLLHVSDLGFLTVPKRAFASPGDLEHFRAILDQNVGSPVPRGFTPMPLPTPPPLPGELARANASPPNAG